MQKWTKKEVQYLVSTIKRNVTQGKTITATIHKISHKLNRTFSSCYNKYYSVSKIKEQQVVLQLTKKMTLNVNKLNRKLQIHLEHIGTQSGIIASQSKENEELEKRVKHLELMLYLKEQEVIDLKNNIYSMKHPNYQKTKYQIKDNTLLLVR